MTKSERTSTDGISVEMKTVAADTQSRCAFHAAALTCGFEAPENAPIATNAYTEKRPYVPSDPYPGNVSFLLGLKNSNNGSLRALIQLWNNEQDRQDTLTAAGMIPARLMTVRGEQEQKELAKEAGEIIELAMVVFMFLYSRGRLSVDPVGPATESEKQAAEILDKIPAQILKSKSQAERKAIAARMGKAWKPGIAAWLKAFKHNLAEQRHRWKAARKTVLIEREGRKLPLIIPICQNKEKTRQLIDRWT